MSISLFCVLLVTFVAGLTDGTAIEPSIAHSVFLPREFDPFCDTYIETVTRMNADEIMHMPQLNDAEFLDQLTRGIDTIPTPMSRAGPNNLFDPNIDEEIQYHADIEVEWEDMMVGGPASINYMGAVMAIASKGDFSLQKNFNYTLIKYPDSYKTTLVQVANEMYNALSGAHTSMNKIQANMRQIPTQMKIALKLITQASPSMTKAMLPRTLSDIGQYATESARVAEDSFERIRALQNLLQEIVLASTRTTAENREAVAALAEKAEKMKQDKITMAGTIAAIKAEIETARQDLEKKRQEYHIAMMNVPGGEWDAAAWQVYASQRPAVLCSGWWIFSKCRSQHNQQFSEYTQEAKQKAEEALTLLKEAENRSKELFNQHVKKQDELGTAINNLAMINFNEVSVNQTIKILLDAAEKIGIIQEQWSRITRFFTSLATKTEHTQKVILRNFIGVISDAETMGKPLEPTDKTLFVMMLVASATEVDGNAHLLFLVAKTYLDVSSEYMVDQIAGLSGLIALQNDVDRDAYVKGVAKKTEITSDKIKKLAVERQRNYELATFNRRGQYTEFIQQAMIQELGIIGIGKR